MSTSFNFFWVFKECFNENGYNFDDVSKIEILERSTFWNESYDVIISVNDVTQKNLSRDSNFIVDVVMWSKLVNSSIAMRSYNLNFIRIWPEKPLFFKGGLGSSSIIKNWH